MLDFKNIAVHYGHQSVLRDVTFRVNRGDRVGIVGPNGSGKSTLFRIILGELGVDSGELIIEQNPRIGWTQQNPSPLTPQETLLEYALRGIPGLAEIDSEMRSLEGDLEDPAKLARYGELQNQFEKLGGYDIETRVKIALGGLGFTTEEFQKPFASFSGGWRMRGELSRVLASRPDLLLLDEPSNYLDLPAVEWLQKYLKAFEGTLLLISHDRYLLRTLTSITVEVDSGTVTRYEGGLDYYLTEREVRFRHLKATRENQDRQREQLQRFVDRFRAKATKAAQAQSRLKQLEKLNEELVVLPKRYTMAGRIRLAEPPASGIEMYRCEDLSFSYDGVHPVFHDVSFQITRGDKVALIGYNGLGKTTLMRVISGRRQPTSGKSILGHNVVTGYLSQEFAETIPPDVSVYRNAKNVIPDGMNEKTFRNQLGAFGFDENDIEKPAGVLSGGEKIRLAFLRLFLTSPNFLLLDEPTTHLDLDGRQLLQDALRAYQGTILIVSHDIEFVRSVATRIIEITHEGVTSFAGGYDYYCEKKAEQAKAQASTPVREESVAVSENAGNKMTSRELRKQRAEARAKIAPQVKALKARIAKAEQKIETLQADLDTASAELFNPKPTTDFAETNRKVRVLQAEIDRYTEDWEAAATELEELTAATEEENK